MDESILLLSYKTIVIVYNWSFVVVFDPSLYQLCNLIERNFCAYSNYCKSIFCTVMQPFLPWYFIVFLTPWIPCPLIFHSFYPSWLQHSYTLLFFYSLRSVLYFLLFVLSPNFDWVTHKPPQCIHGQRFVHLSSHLHLPHLFPT